MHGPSSVSSLCFGLSLIYNEGLVMPGLEVQGGREVVKDSIMHIKHCVVNTRLSPPRGSVVSAHRDGQVETYEALVAIAKLGLRTENFGMDIAAVWGRQRGLLPGGGDGSILALERVGSDSPEASQWPAAWDPHFLLGDTSRVLFLY